MRTFPSPSALVLVLLCAGAQPLPAQTDEATSASEAADPAEGAAASVQVHRTRAEEGITSPAVEGQTAVIRLAASSRDHDALREIIRRLKQQKHRDGNFARVVATLQRETASQRFPEDIQDRELPALALAALEQGTSVPLEVQTEILSYLARDPAPTRIPPEAYAPLRRRKARAMLRTWSALEQSTPEEREKAARTALAYLHQSYSREPRAWEEAEELVRSHLKGDTATSAAAVLRRSRDGGPMSAEEFDINSAR